MNLSDGFGEAEVAEAKRLFSEDRFVAIEAILGRTTPDEELRYDLAYLLWKTLRNRRAGNTNLNKTREVLDCLQRKAAALASELAPMLAHPGTNTLAADDAAFFLQWDPLVIEHVAERAASHSASATEALNKIGRAKDLGRPVDTERQALVAYLSQIRGGKQPVYVRPADRKAWRKILSIAEDLRSSRCGESEQSPSIGCRNQGPPPSGPPSK